MVPSLIFFLQFQIKSICSQIMTKRTLIPLRIKATQEIVPAGIPFSLSFEKTETGKTALRAISLCGKINVKTFKYQAFFKVPAFSTLQRWSNDGIAKTVTGHKTELDGHGPDGSPSWFLLLGMI